MSIIFIKPPKEPNVYSVRTDEWKYIRNLHDKSEELYKLEQDPNENQNLIDEEVNQSIEMRKLMDKILNLSLLLSVFKI